MAAIRCLYIVALSALVHSNPLFPRQDSSTLTAPAAAKATSGALMETTVNGKLTTINVAGPVDSTTTSTSSQSKTSSSSPAQTSLSDQPEIPHDIAAGCRNDIMQPICQPHEGQELQIGNTYWGIYPHALLISG